VTYEPQPGDIGLTQIHGGVGLGIRIGQWLNGDGFADYEHAFVVVGEVDGYDGPQLIEAEPGGARQMPLVTYDADRVAYLHCPESDRDAVAAAALELIGTPYSFLDYGSLALHRLHIPAPLLRRYIRSSGHEICSQLADLAACRGGWHLYTDGRWPQDVTPGDLRLLVRKQNADLLSD
jgi:hypothetical protein